MNNIIFVLFLLILTSCTEAINKKHCIPIKSYSRGDMKQLNNELKLLSEKSMARKIYEDSKVLRQFIYICHFCKDCSYI